MVLLWRKTVPVELYWAYVTSCNITRTTASVLSWLRPWRRRSVGRQPQSGNFNVVTGSQLCKIWVGISRSFRFVDALKTAHLRAQNHCRETEVTPSSKKNANCSVWQSLRSD